jgi:hypothetical protein
MYSYNYILSRGIKHGEEEGNTIGTPTKLQFPKLPL